MKRVTAGALGREQSGPNPGGWAGGGSRMAAGSGAIRSEVLVPKGFWVGGINTSISFIGTASHSLACTPW